MARTIPVPPRENSPFICATSVSPPPLRLPKDRLTPVWARRRVILFTLSAYSSRWQISNMRAWRPCRIQSFSLKSISCTRRMRRASKPFSTTCPIFWASLRTNPCRSIYRIASLENRGQLPSRRRRMRPRLTSARTSTLPFEESSCDKPAQRRPGSDGFCYRRAGSKFRILNTLIGYSTSGWSIRAVPTNRSTRRVKRYLRSSTCTSRTISLSTMSKLYE